jgi:amino-acid N-acetyltransferase
VTDEHSDDGGGAAHVDLRLERVEDEDSLAAVAELLAANGLPHDDVRSGPGRFYLATLDGERVAAGGLEGAGPHGLLRSVVVRESARGQGVGTGLCVELEARAAESGVETLHLLTTTAESFFVGRGYEAAERADAPRAVRETREFSELCPETATYMRKRLVDGGAGGGDGDRTER